MQMRLNPIAVVTVKKGYSLNALRDFGIYPDETQLAKLADLGVFPRRVGHLIWDGDTIDEWLRQFQND